ncbi:MAG: efflux RND transporter periplasmic adaptor subunit [Planctomycetia bacterium]|nr:efflux RND transporter periplasmic adaptor subunit [Planctomycetia bacterium]
MRRFVSYFFVIFFFLPFTSDLSAQMPGPKEKPKIYVPVEKVISLSPVITKKYVGTLEAIEKVVSLARISGDIIEVAFKDGDRVEKDQLLFRIDDTRYQAAVKSAEAHIKQVKARIRYAQNNYERNHELSEQNAVSKDEAESALSVLEAFQAELLQAEASLVLAQDDLIHTKIRSMINGRVGRTNYTLGNYITPASGPLVTVVQYDPIYVRFSMSERDFLNLFGTVEELQKTASIQLKLPNDRIYPEKGKIAFVNNEIKTHTDSVNIWATFENPKEILRSGGIATVLLTKQNGRLRPAVKLSAIMFDKDGYYVYVMNAKKIVERRNVEVGPSDGVHQTIFGGLETEEIVLVGGTHKVIPGAEVIPVFPEEKKDSVKPEESKKIPAPTGAGSPVSPAASAPAGTAGTSVPTGTVPASVLDKTAVPKKLSGSEKVPGNAPAVSPALGQPPAPPLDLGGEEKKKESASASAPSVGKLVPSEGTVQEGDPGK